MNCSNERPLCHGHFKSYRILNPIWIGQETVRGIFDKVCAIVFVQYTTNVEKGVTECQL